MLVFELLKSDFNIFFQLTLLVLILKQQVLDSIQKYNNNRLSQAHEKLASPISY